MAGIGNTILLVFGMVITALARNCQEKNDRIEPKIVIIGAGIAGVSAARKLQELGYRNIVIWEGSNRIGGRMKDIKLGNSTVEQGANWIQSLGSNPVFQNAKAYGLKHVVTDWEDYAAYDYDGTDITKKIKQLEEKFYIIFKKTEELANQTKTEGRLDSTYRAGLIRNKWNPKTRFEDLVETYYTDFESGYPPDVSSLKESVFDTYYIHGNQNDANVIDSRGYAFIARQMLKNSIKKGGISIRFNRYVNKIKQENNKVVLQTTTKKSITADVVIVTVSIGVLQNRLIEFIPNLPDWKLDAIDQIQMALFYNIFMKFPYQFWDDRQFILHAGQKRNYFPIIQNVNKINPGSNILHIPTIWQEARRIDRIQREQVKSEIMQILDKLFRNKIGRDIPEPLYYEIPTFYSDPLFKGCFSNIPPGYSNERHSNLSLPVGRIYFAGEATSVSHYGYVHGAWYSGVDTADRIHSFLSKER